MLVNTKYIYKINASEIELSNGRKIPISRRRLAEIKDVIGRNLARRIN